VGRAGNKLRLELIPDQRRATDTPRRPLIGGTSKEPGLTRNREEEVAMLGAHPISPVLLATDLTAAKEFYHDRLGLQILSETDASITVACGGGPG
jgi:hypothetical protein